MVPINANTVGVEDEAELRSAVGNNAYNYIYLVNDIAMTAGITIYQGKTSLVIDGEYPAGSGQIHTLTDMDSTDYYDTIGIGSSSSIALTFRNMIIRGGNYYGVPYIVENIWPAIDTSGVSVIYENVTYTGPQITYNRYGLTRYVNCDITITQTGSVPPEEVGEVNRVEIGGITTINHTSTSDAVFWYNNVAAASSLTILSGAQVDIRSQNSYFMYNRNVGILEPVTYTLQPNASLNLQVNRGISLDSGHSVSSFLVDENASFYYVQTGSNTTYASLYMDGAVTVRQGARFYMQAANGTQPLIRYTSGANRSLTVSNPVSFVLYSPNAAALNAQGTEAFSLTGGQLNTWTTARTPVESAGGFDDTPANKWFKSEYAQPVVFTGTFTASATTVASHNMVAADAPYPAVNLLRLDTARVLSIGDWPVDPDPIVDDGRPVTGTTEPEANLRLIYDIEGTEHIVEGRAQEDGRFTIATSLEDPPTIPADTIVEIWSNIPFLIKMTEALAVAVGELGIESAPDWIVFRTPPIALGPPLLPRTNPEEPVVIIDTRVDASRWELLASITGPLQTAQGDVLPDAVVFVPAGGGNPVTLSDVPIVVYTGGPSISPTPVFWPVTEGILVRITEPVRYGVYTTYVIWDLRAI